MIIFQHTYLAKQTSKSSWLILASYKYEKKFKTALLVVQCNAGGIFWCDSLLLARRLRHLGFSSCISRATVALNTYYNSSCGRAVLLTNGWASASIYFFFTSISAFLK